MLNKTIKFSQSNSGMIQPSARLTFKVSSMKLNSCSFSLLLSNENLYVLKVHEQFKLANDFLKLRVTVLEINISRRRSYCPIEPLFPLFWKHPPVTFYTLKPFRNGKRMCNLLLRKFFFDIKQYEDLVLHYDEHFLFYNMIQLRPYLNSVVVINNKWHGRCTRPH